jgi:hypothetical protein
MYGVDQRRANHSKKIYSLGWSMCRTDNWAADTSGRRTSGGGSGSALSVEDGSVG